MAARDDLRPETGIPTGSKALDDILGGGYAPARVHLIEGRPGSGKTTLAMQFLMEARDRGDKTLYVTLSEGREELAAAAASHGWSLEGIDIYELVPPELSLDPAREQSIVYSSDLELGETVQLVIDRVEAIKPDCVVFDSLSDIRLLAGSPLRYRRQVLALKHYFSGKGITVLLIDDLSEDFDAGNANLHSLVHGAIRLEQLIISYGAERRRLRVFKMRGRAFRGGFHDYVIRKGGLSIFPRLVAAEHKGEIDEAAAAGSGVPELDRLLGGGLHRGTSTLVMGPAGTGKSTIALQFVCAALERGERALFISFDETRRNFYKRAEGLQIHLDKETENFTFLQVDPAELSPGELTSVIRGHVENGTSVVVLDSQSGYQNAMPEEQFLLLQMHELLTYLNQQGVITVLVLAQHGLVGAMQSPVDLTYLSDTVVLLRYFEASGELHRAISVLKKRTGSHEHAIREYHIGGKGVKVGAPLTNFTGILTGIPRYSGHTEALFGPQEEA